MGVQTQIARIENAKTAIKTAIEEKGVTVQPNTKIDEIAVLISNIKTGGTNISLNITGAAVGQIVKISAVDANGVPTAWEPIDIGEDIVVDTTLTQDGQAADAKITGEKITQLKEDLSSVYKRWTLL